MSQLLRCADPRGDTMLQPPWNQALNEMIDNSNQAPGETQISGYLGFLTLNDKLNYFSVAFIHKSIQAFHPYF